MPSHQDRREPLPKGYQFGDAALSDWVRYILPAAEAMRVERDERIASYLKPMMERVADSAVNWNVIEGESFASDAERHPVTLGFETYRDPGDEA